MWSSGFGETEDLIRSRRLPSPNGEEVLNFAMSCSWAISHVLLRLGVVIVTASTRVGKT